MNNDNLKDFLLECHVATGGLENLVQSLLRSIQASEYENADTHPDRELVKLLAERIHDLNERLAIASRPAFPAPKKPPIEALIPSQKLS